MRNLSQSSLPSPKESLVPLWDSSDPTRNPPPMPLQPGSPTLNPAAANPNGIVANSPFRMTASPIRQPFHARNSHMSINEERTLEILENSREFKSILAAIQDTIIDGGATSNSAVDNSAILNTLLEAVMDTKAASYKTSQAVTDSIPSIISSIDSELDNSKTISALVSTLIEQTREISLRAQTQESSMSKLVRFSENQEASQQQGGGLVTNEDLDRVMTRKNNVVLDEFATFSKNLGTHQQQSMALLRGIKDSFDGSSKYTDLICNKVSEESEQVVSELSKIIKRSQESSTKQVNAIPQRISELEDCITTLLDKIVLTMTSSASASNNDHLIPEIVTKITNLEADLEQGRKDDVNNESHVSDLLYDRLEELVNRHEAENQTSIKTITDSNTRIIRASIDSHGERVEKSLSNGLSDIEGRLDRIIDGVSVSKKDRQEAEQEHEQQTAKILKQLLENALSNNRHDIISTINSCSKEHQEFNREQDEQQLKSIKDALETYISSSKNAIVSSFGEHSKEYQHLAQKHDTEQLKFIKDTFESCISGTQESILSAIGANTKEHKTLAEESNIRQIKSIKNVLEETISPGHNAIMSTIVEHSKEYQNQSQKRDASHLESLQNLLDLSINNNKNSILTAIDSSTKGQQSFIQDQKVQQLTLIKDAFTSSLSDTQKSILSCVDSRSSDLESGFSEVDSKITLLSKSINSNATESQNNMSSLETKLSNLFDIVNDSSSQRAQKLSNLEELISNLENSSMKDIVSSVSDLQQQLSGTSKSIEKLKKIDKLDFLETEISGVGSKLVKILDGLDSARNEVQLFRTSSNEDRNSQTNKLKSIEEILSTNIVLAISNVDKQIQQTLTNTSSADEKLDCLSESLKTYQSTSRGDQTELKDELLRTMGKLFQNELDEIRQLNTGIQSVESHITNTESLVEGSKSLIKDNESLIKSGVETMSSNFDGIKNQLSILSTVIEAEISTKLDKHDLQHKEQADTIRDHVSTILSSVLESLESAEKRKTETYEMEQSRKIQELEEQLKAMTQRAAEAEAKSSITAQRVESLENALQKKEQEEKERIVKEKEHEVLKFMNWDIERHEKKIEQLEDHAEQLRAEKATLQQEVASLETIYTGRVEDLEKLESRVEAFERRLSQALLNRSKNILGSATMAIINSVPQRTSNQHSRGRDSDSSSTYYSNVSRSNSTYSSSGLIPPVNSQANDGRTQITHASESESDEGYGKENEGSLIIKKQRVGKSAKKNIGGRLNGRSVSMFTKNETLDFSD